MTHFIPLDKQAHADFGWQPPADYSVFRQQLVAPVAYTEIAMLTGQFILGFIRTNEQFRCIVVLAVEPDRNLYIHPETGQWIGHYVPQHFRARPFTLGHRPETPDQPLLCIDERALIPLAKQPPHRLFHGAGKEAELTPDAAHILDFLHQRIKAQLATDQATGALADAELIQPWTLRIPSDDGEKSVGGLYRVDETRLQQLPDERYLQLRNAGAIPLAYAQIISATHINQLTQRINAVNPLFKDPQTQLDLDQIFGAADDGLIRFS